MSVQTLKLAGKQFVLISRREYDQMLAKLQAQARQDRGDVAKALRRSKEPSIPLNEARMRVGL